MINFNIPPFTGKEFEYMKEAVENQKICGDGPFTKKCDEWIEAQTGTAKCLLTTSCTHATELAALLADIKPGDEVILPSYTFVSTADAFVLRGATAVFVDIRPDTMNIDEKLIEDAVTERTKVIAPVHYAGVGCEMDVIMDIARRYILLLVDNHTGNETPGGSAPLAQSVCTLDCCLPCFLPGIRLIETLCIFFQLLPPSFLCT